MPKEDNLSFSRERDWIEGIQRSDRKVFKEIFEFYLFMLRRLASASNVSADQAEDMIQDIFVSLWERRDSLSIAPGELSKYLIGSLNKKILQYRRNTAVRSNLISTRSDAVSDLLPKPFPTDSQVLTAEFNAVFLLALKGLSEIQRQIVSLRWGEGMSYGKISELLGISENSAMLHASRIKQVLRPVLKRYMSGLE